MELTPPTPYRMSISAAEVEELLLSIYTKIPTDTIRTSLSSPDDLTIPTTKAVADAISVITSDLEQLGALALLDQLDMGSNLVIGTLPVERGGTGANTLPQAQQNLGILPESAIQQLIEAAIPVIQSVDLGSEQATGILSISKGGTGAAGVSQARQNLQVWSSDQSEMLKIDMVEALRRSYAEVGYNLVIGSFQAGFALINANDVALDEATGRAFSGPAGTYPADTNPTSVGFVDRSDEIRVSGSIDAVQFGVDVSGNLSSDTQLLAALQFSANSGIEIVVSGKCRLTQTMLQPANSIVRVDGIVFCEDPAGLTDSLLWDVSGPNDTGCRTEIRAMTLSTSPTTGSAVVDRLMKPLRVSTARVKCGKIRTFGFQLSGPEIGPTGYEINVIESSSIIKKWDALHRDACGFQLTTTDCTIGKILTALYPVAPKLGSTNHVGSVHCWGLPATAANEYQNAQMLTGPTLGAATVVGHIYVDSLDTDGYNTVPAGNEGVGIIFAGYECSVGTLVYRVHPQTKTGKIKLGRFTGFSNSVSSLQVPGGTGFDLAAPFIYDNDAAKWRNRIDMSNVQGAINRFTYTTELAPSGFTTFTGSMTVEKIGHDALIKLFFTATAVNNTSTDDFIINLPAGLSLLQGTTSLVSQRTCLLMSDTDHTLTNDFAYVDGASKIRIAYRKRNTGQLFFLKQTALTTGIIEIVLRASITNQM